MLIIENEIRKIITNCLGYVEYCEEEMIMCEDYKDKARKLNNERMYTVAHTKKLGLMAQRNREIQLISDLKMALARSGL